MTSIHATAVISPCASLGSNVEIGPFCIVEDNTVIGDGCKLASHCVIKSGTRLGNRNQIGEFAVLGGVPQHLASGLVVGGLDIGHDNTFREYVTVHRGLHPGQATVLGNDNLLMVSAHVAHDCIIGDHVVLTNNTLLGGHVEVQSRAYLGGAAAVHQFCRIGSLAMVGGMARVVQDVPPYVMVDGQSTRVVGLNQVGLRRSGVALDDVVDLKRAYRIVYRNGMNWTEAAAAVLAEFAAGPARAMGEFLSVGNRGFVAQRTSARRATIDLEDARDSLRKAA